MIKLKGKVSGMLQCVIPDDTDEKQMLLELGEVASAGKRMLEGSNVVMDMRGRALSFGLMEEIWRQFIEPSGCKVVSWIVLDAASQEVLKKSGVPLGEPKASSKGKAAAAVGAAGLLFSGTLRGGQRIEHDGDVLVVGHANTGSEILATGHVVILGWLKGLVHAGCNGNNNMSIAARSLESGQVRIGNKVGLIERDSSFWGKSTIVTVSEEEVLISEWPAV